MQCNECGLMYETRSQADYCAKADLDPRIENDLLRRGLLKIEWIPRPVAV